MSVGHPLMGTVTPWGEQEPLSHRGGGRRKETRWPVPGAQNPNQMTLESCWQPLYPSSERPNFLCILSLVCACSWLLTAELCPPNVTPSSRVWVLGHALPCHCPPVSVPSPGSPRAGVWGCAGAGTRGCPRAVQNNAINAIWCRDRDPAREPDTAFHSR